MKKIDLPDGLGLRLATSNDTLFIESLFHSTREFLYVAEQENEYIKNIIDQQLELQTQSYGSQSPNLMTFIIDKQGIPIGRLVLDFGSNVAHVIDVALIKEARNKGYGKSIIQAVQYTASKQSLPVSLMVSKQDSIARNMYGKLGFSTEESNETHELMTWYPSAQKTFINV